MPALSPRHAPEIRRSEKQATYGPHVTADAPSHGLYPLANNDEAGRHGRRRRQIALHQSGDGMWQDSWKASAPNKRYCPVKLARIAARSSFAPRKQAAHHGTKPRQSSRSYADLGRSDLSCRRERDTPVRIQNQGDPTRIFEVMIFQCGATLF